MTSLVRVKGGWINVLWGFKRYEYIYEIIPHKSFRLFNPQRLEFPFFYILCLPYRGDKYITLNVYIVWSISREVFEMSSGKPGLINIIRIYGKTYPVETSCRRYFHSYVEKYVWNETICFSQNFLKSLSGRNCILLYILPPFFLNTIQKGILVKIDIHSKKRKSPSNLLPSLVDLWYDFARNRFHIKF